MHVCMCVRTYVHNCIIVSPYAICMYIRTYVRTHACTCAHTYVRMHVCMYACMHVCMYLYMYVCLFLIVNVKVFNSTWNVNLIYFPREMWKGVFYLCESWSGTPLPPPPPLTANQLNVSIYMFETKGEEQNWLIVLITWLPLITYIRYAHAWLCHKRSFKAVIREWSNITEVYFEWNST